MQLLDQDLSLYIFPFDRFHLHEGSPEGTELRLGLFEFPLNLGLLLEAEMRALQSEPQALESLLRTVCRGADDNDAHDADDSRETSHPSRMTSRHDFNPHRVLSCPDSKPVPALSRLYKARRHLGSVVVVSYALTGKGRTNVKGAANTGRPLQGVGFYA